MHPAADGNLLIDARSTRAAYKVHRRTGALIWRLGGKSSSFALRAASGQTLDNAGELFACQHDPQQTGPDQYTFFDNEAAGTAQLPYSRAIVVRLDERARTLPWSAPINQPDALAAPSQGNAQTMPSGHLFVGWGPLPYFSQFSASGSLPFNARFPAGVTATVLTGCPGRPPEPQGATPASQAGGSVAAAGGGILARGSAARWFRPAVRCGPAGDGHLPRRSYGDYLSEMLAEAERGAAPWARVSRITSRVVAIRRDCGRRALRLDLAAEGRIDADVAVLATGSPPPVPAFPVTRGPRFVADPWEPGALDGVADGSPVVIAGTGPTMIDVAIVLTGRHPGTTVVAVSRHGLLPHVHSWPRRASTAVGEPIPSKRAVPLRLTGLIRDVGAKADMYEGDWQDIVEALRPLIPSLWQRLPEADKRLFLRHVARYWEVHRHRMPPSTTEQVKLLQSAGRLAVLKACIASAADTAAGLRVSVDLGGSQARLTAGWLIDCTGPAADVRVTADLLLRNLLDGGLARTDPLRLGLDADSRGAVRGSGGTAASDMYALGPPLRGIWYETTAIPEIRDQAAALARLLVTRMAHAGPRSAA